MIRKVAIILVALAVVLLAAAGAFAALLVSIDNDMYDVGPTSAALVDQAVGIVDPKDLRLSGDLLLTSNRSAGFGFRPLGDPSREPQSLFPAVFVGSIAPGGHYVVAWTGSRWQIVRLSDLHAVAEIQGAEPFFIDDHRVLAVFQGKGCGRQDATILDLRERTASKIRLSGDKAALSPVAVDGSVVVAQRLARGDSACTTAGFARVDLGTGSVRTLTKVGSVIAVNRGHVWLGEGDAVKVFDANGLTASSSPRVTAAASDGGVVYAETPYHLRGDGIAPDAPTRLRFGAPTGPRPEDPAGDAVLEPRQISAVPGSAAVVVAHRGRDLPEGGHATVLSWCVLPQLRCRELFDVTFDGARVVGVVSANAFKTA